MRALVAAIALGMAAVAVGFAGASAVSRPAAQPALARLTIKVWPQGAAAGAASTTTLRCGPPGGTHPAKWRACARLRSVRAPFRPVPLEAACTMIYGGPEEALVTGSFRGKRISARFSRSDGCQIARWDRVAILFALGAGA